MKTHTINIEIKLTEPMLGSLPGNKEVFQDFIQSKAPEATGQDEVVCVHESLEKGTTVFPRDEKGIFIWDYQFKGFLKEAIGVMAEIGETNLSKWTFKRVVDSAIFVTPRKIHLMGSDGKNVTTVGYLERPLRAETMQGDRIALARSEKIEAGATAKIKIDWFESSNAKSKFTAIDSDLIVAALNYGKLKGLGQWRNASFGRFEWKQEKA